MIAPHRTSLLDRAVIFLLSCLAIIPFDQIFHLGVGFAIFNAGEIFLLALFFTFIIIIIMRGIARQHAVYVLFALSTFAAYSLYALAILNVSTASLINQTRYFLPFVVACMAMLSRLYIDKSKLLNKITYKISISAFLAIMIHLFFKDFIAHSFASDEEMLKIIIEGGRMYWGGGTLALFGFAALMLEKNKYSRYALNFSTLLILTGSIFTQNRTILLGLIFFYVSTQIFVFKKSIKSVFYFLVLVIISFLIFIWLSSDDMLALLQKRLFINDAADAEFEHAFLIGRVYLYDQYFNILQSTFPFGQGLGMPLAYGVFSDEPNFTTDISFLSFVLPFGVIGLGLLLIFIFKIFRIFKIYAMSYRSDRSPKVFYFLLISTVFISFNIDMFSRNVFVVYLAVFAVLHFIPSAPKSGQALR